MNKTRLALLGLLGILVAGLIVWSRGPKEPSYQGRSLSSWLEEWRESGYDRTNPAAMAILSIGSNGVPILLADLSKDRSPMERKFWRFARKVIPDESNPTLQDLTRALDAANAINLLGVEAKSAFPTLTNLLSSKGHRLPASIALAGIGPEGITVLIQALTNKEWIVGQIAAVALGDARSDWDKVVPALVEIVKIEARTQEDFLLQGAAANTLVQLHKEPELVVPVFEQFLSSTNAKMRAWAAINLDRLGTDAKTAVPLLLKARTDTDTKVRKAVESALKEIDPKAATSP